MYKRLFPHYLFCVCTFLLLSGISHAQAKNPADKKGSVSGKVMDGVSNTPVEYASIAVYIYGNKKPVNGATTDKKGVFTIGGLDTGYYRIVIDFIGYQADTLSTFISSKNMAAKLTDIFLTKKSQTLQGVVVVAKKPLLENKIDKMVYNAEQDVTAQGGVATDLLKKIPQVSVDVDGNVEVQGNTNIRFLINGKPSSIFGNSLSEALQSIPASQIKSIEVITSPGAKYDAEGTGGIINIILKDSKVRGINGNINLSAGSRLENGSLNLHVRKGNFGLNGFVNGNGQLPSTTIKTLDRHSYDTTQKTQTTLLQDGYSDFHRTGMQGGLGFEWEINKKNSLSGNFSYNHFNNESHGSNNQQVLTTTIPAGTPVSSLNTIFRPENHFNQNSYDYSLNYKKSIKEDQELTAQFNTSYGVSGQNYVQQQYNAAGDSLFSGLHSSNPGRDHETEVQVDYTQPLAPKVKLETGAKAGLRDIQSISDVSSYSTAIPYYKYDTSQSSSLHYKRQVYAAYASVTFALGKWLEVKSGLRFEHTETEPDFSKAANVHVPGYNTLAPSVLLAHHFGDNQLVKLGYSRRVQRPSYEDLNPFVNALDPKNIRRGNPDLQPELGDNAELGYSKTFDKGSSINLNAFYRGSRHDIQPYYVYYPSFKIGDSVYTNVSVNTFENIGTQQVFGFSAYGSVPLGQKITVRGNFSFFDKYIVNKLVANNSANSLNYRINFNTSYQASKTLVAEFFGSFNSAHNEIQGKFPSFTSYNFAFRKLIWNKKGSIGFTTTNPFNNYVNQATELKGDQFVLNSLRKMPYRSFGISFTFKFGKLEFKKEKEEDDEHPDVPSSN